jgi:thiamine biosynthesis lipoprotein
MADAYAAQWPAIGTTARVVVTDAGALGAARAIVVAELAALDLACSRFRDDSEIAVVAMHSGHWTPISPLLAEVLGCALDVARDTGGDVDPTMGTDLSLLGYDRDFADVVHTTARATNGAVVPLTCRTAHRTSWHDVELDLPAGRVRVPHGVVIDLGAIAKAWCADRCARRIAAELGTGVLVSLGGDIATAGAGPAGGWAVRVQDRPDADDGPVATVLLRDGFALATSSTVTRAWRRGSQQLHHIIDPATRRPADAVWRTVSVAAPTCVAANAASTASIVRGHAAPAWLAAQGLAARLVDARGTVRAVCGWPQERVAS